jgi:hypothetical protein
VRRDRFLISLRSIRVAFIQPRQRPRAKPRPFDGDISSEQIVAKLTDRGVEARFFQQVPGQVDAKQDDARNGLTAAKDQITEILVFCQEEAPLGLRPHQDLRIACSRRNFRHVNNIVSGGAQMRNQAAVHTFIGKPAHG